MRQVLFVIPLHEWTSISWVPDVPIYGYGLMLFCAYLLCTTLGKYLCKRQKIDGKIIPDLAIWLFVGGIVGSRIVYVIEERRQFSDLWHILRVWDGGLVFYGGIGGGVIAYFAFDFIILRKLNISTWRLLDVIAPCVCLGAALGRIGCLCTGCCYGNVACETCPAIHFPLGSPATNDMIQRGYQTPQGFLLADKSMAVALVEAGSAAANAGLRPMDVILEVNGDRVFRQESVTGERGELTLAIWRDGARVALPPFEPRGIGVHPTQIYDTIGMLLLMLFLLSYFPYRRRQGELMVFLMFGYGVHRYLSESLRLDNAPGWFGLTLSQTISILVLLAGVILAIVVYRRPPIVDEPPPQETPVTPTAGGATA